ncbi:MAG: acyltransferase [Bacteroidales bacterium]|nr:acyltransferase [Bacteroidales bacterium]
MNIIKRLYLDIQELRRRIRSYYFCFKYLPFEQAKKMPFYFENAYRVECLQKGSIVLKGKIRPRMILFREGVHGMHFSPTIFYIEHDGKLVFEDDALIMDGCTLRVDQGGVMTLGKHFISNRFGFYRCSKEITFGNNVMLGWNNEISDNDGHEIYVDGKQIDGKAPVRIGNHVWITTHVRIGKGVVIPDGCIVAKGAVVTKIHNVPNTLIGGVPAKEIKSNVEWKYDNV